MSDSIPTETPDTGATIAPKDALDAYLRMYDRQMTHYEKTQGVEWKGNFGVWALLAGAIVSVANSPFVIYFETRLTAAGLTVVLAIAHLTWLALVHGSEQWDKVLWGRYRFEVERRLGTSHADEKVSRIRNVVWLLCEWSITAVLAAALCWELLP
jgi:hypothetical protein